MSSSKRTIAWKDHDIDWRSTLETATVGEYQFQIDGSHNAKGAADPKGKWRFRVEYERFGVTWVAVAECRSFDHALDVAEEFKASVMPDPSVFKRGDKVWWSGKTTREARSEAEVIDVSADGKWVRIEWDMDCGSLGVNPILTSVPVETLTRRNG